MMWRHVYPEWAEKLGIEYDIKARHYSEVVAEKIETGEFKFPDNGQDADHRHLARFLPYRPGLGRLRSRRAS